MLSISITKQSIAQRRLNPPKIPYSLACSINSSLPKKYMHKTKMPNLILHKFLLIDNFKNVILLNPKLAIYNNIRVDIEYNIIPGIPETTISPST